MAAPSGGLGLSASTGGLRRPSEHNPKLRKGRGSASELVVSDANEDRDEELLLCLLPPVHFWFFSAKHTADHPVEHEELHDSFLSAFLMICLDLAHFLLLRRTQSGERCISCTPTGADMKKRQIKRQSPAKPEVPQTCTDDVI